jgi:hypothetical protein
VPIFQIGRASNHQGDLEMTPHSKIRNALFLSGLLFAFAVLVVRAGTLFWATAHASSPAAAVETAEKPYVVEWVYRVKWGHQEEFFAIFKKYQVPVLDKEKQLGYVTDYSIYAPSLHTSEDSRWDYRVIIVYKNEASHGHAEEINKELFPDDVSRKREEQRRWEITEVHWDMPIHVVDPNAGE